MNSNDKEALEYALACQTKLVVNLELEKIKLQEQIEELKKENKYFKQLTLDLYRDNGMLRWELKNEKENH